MATTTVSRTRKSGGKLELETEVRLLRSFMVSILREDAEGAYRKEFVAEMRRAVLEKPRIRFRDAESFAEDVAGSGYPLQ